MNLWLSAFLLTLIAELPVYLRAGRGLPILDRWVLAMGTSTVTHPIIWFVAPWGDHPFWVTSVVAEIFAIATEAVLCSVAGIRNPLLWSLAANVFSFSCGMLWQMLQPV